MLPSIPQCRGQPQSQNHAAQNVRIIHLGLSIFNIAVFTRNFDSGSFCVYRKYFCSNVKNIFSYVHCHSWSYKLIPIREKKYRIFFPIGKLQYNPLFKHLNFTCIIFLDYFLQNFLHFQPQYALTVSSQIHFKMYLVSREHIRPSPDWIHLWVFTGYLLGT